ncbi:hypothetical protein PUN28_006077 [Cardiocondyla obscurior]|uniref:Uncharacterized protein n=1 Tax=Cardiocondyla obscurior TaxID=286306 RepID=A0AAW2G6Z7_9HYME
MTIYRLHCHSIVGCEESPVTAVGGAGLPAGSFVSATEIYVFDIRTTTNHFTTQTILFAYRAIPCDFSHCNVNCVTSIFSNF